MSKLTLSSLCADKMWPELRATLQLPESQGLTNPGREGLQPVMSLGRGTALSPAFLQLTCPVQRGKSFPERGKMVLTGDC